MGANITFENKDCMDGMKEFPDLYFDLAIVDPPYGDFGADRRGGSWAAKYGSTKQAKILAWDVAPDKRYFDELFRVSKNQIIFGGNYFELPPTRCFIVYRKLNIPPKGFTMSPVEYAWTSFSGNAKLYEHFSRVSGKEKRFHPTQKPVGLYEDCLRDFAKAGDKILDTHVGSGSSLIACYNLGFDAVGYEIDEEYFGKASARLTEEMAQIRMGI